MRAFKDHRGEGSSAMTPPSIDRSKVASSFLFRCDQSASISIYVTGLPFPQVTWYLGSRPIVDSSEFRVAMDTDGRKHTLVVTKVTEDLEGRLKVKAVNCAGQDQWEFEIKTYKFFSGRSHSDGNKFTTLPLLQPTGKRKGRSSTPSPKSLQKKKTNTDKRFEMTEDEYENWQKEMERRSHMRSIDDILESLSDEDPDAAVSPVPPPSTENKTKSKDMEKHPTSIPSITHPFASPPPPPPTRHATCGSFQEQLSSSETRTHDVAFRDSLPAGVTEMYASSRKPETPLRITQGLKSATVETRDIEGSSLLNDIPLWEMFGVKLSEYCRTILSSCPVDLVDTQKSQHAIHAPGAIQPHEHGIHGPGAIQPHEHGIHGPGAIIQPHEHGIHGPGAIQPHEHGIHGPGAIQPRHDIHFVEETSHPTKPQSLSMPVGRKVLVSSRPAENQAKPVFPEKTRIPISTERLGQQRPATIRSLSEDPTKPVTPLPDGGTSPNLRPSMQPKGDATQRVTQLLDGSQSPNARPPLAPKPSFKDDRYMRGTTIVKDQDSKTSDSSGSVKADSSAASQPRYRAEAEVMNSNSKFTPKAQTSQGRGAASLDRSESGGSDWEPSETDTTLVQGTSSLDRGQNLFQWGPAVDRNSAEVRGENQRRRLEIKAPNTRGGGRGGGVGGVGGEVGGGGEEGRGRGGGGLPTGEIFLETHFNEPRSSQKTPEALTGPVLELPAIDKTTDRAKADSVALQTPSDVIRKKPPIAKDKPSWNPSTGAKGRGIPRPGPAVPLRAEHTEIGSSKQNLGSQPSMTSESPSSSSSTTSKPTRLVRRARSQSSGRTDEMTISCEEEEKQRDTSGYLFGATSAVQLSYNQEMDVENQPNKQSQQSGIGRFQASAAKSEGLLTARKRSASPTVTPGGAVKQNGGGGAWRVRMPVSKSVDLLDAANSMESMQRIGRRSLSKEWHVVTVTTKEEITILHRPTTTTTMVTGGATSHPVTMATTKTRDHDDVKFKPQLRSSKPFAV